MFSHVSQDLANTNTSGDETGGADESTEVSHYLVNFKTCFNMFKDTRHKRDW